MNFKELRKTRCNRLLDEMNKKFPVGSLVVSRPWVHDKMEVVLHAVEDSGLQYTWLLDKVHPIGGKECHEYSKLIPYDERYHCQMVGCSEIATHTSILSMRLYCGMCINKYVSDKSAVKKVKPRNQ